MAKRILAIVMALVMSLSLLSVEAFADTNGTVSATVSGNTLSLTWEALGSAAKYVVTVTNTSGTTTGSTTVTTNSATVTVSGYGTMNISVIAYNSTNVVIGSFTGSTYVAQSSSGSNITVSGSSTGSSTATWSAVAGVSTYYISWTATNSANGGSDTTGSTSYTIPVDYSALTSVTVRIGNSSGNAVASWTPSYNPSNPGYGYGTGYGQGYGGVSVSGNYLYWSNWASSSTYRNLIRSYTVSVNGRSYTAYGTSFDASSYLNATYATNGVVAFTVSAVLTTGQTISVGSATFTLTTQGGGNSGYVWIGGTTANPTVNWYGLGTQSYTVTAYGNGTTPLGSTRVSGTSVAISSLVNLSSIYGRYTYITFSVYAMTSNTSVGSATYYPGSYTGGGYNPGYGYGTGLTATLSGSTANITWSPVAGVTNYRITYVASGYQQQYYDMVAPTANDTHVSFTWTGGLFVQVQYVYNNQYYTIGSVTVSSTGNITYGSSGYVGSGSGSSNSGNGNVTTKGCTLNVGTTSSTVSWNAVYGAVRYVVVYTNRDTNYSGTQENVYGNSATIPLGSSNCSSFDVQIIPMTSYAPGSAISGSIMTASYTRSTSSQTGTSTTKGLTLKENGTNSTTVTWDEVTNASYYLVSFRRLEDNVGQEQVTTKTSFELPLGKRIGFEIAVYASLRDGTMRTVGSAIHYANTDYPSTGSTTTKPAEDNTSVYVTGFKGTVGNKSVRLSWNAAKNAGSYKVYWKRSSKTEWKLAKTTTARSLTISGLINGTSYDFKVVANGYDSGILTTSPSSTSTATTTAPDPSGAGTTTSKVPEITSITGGSGSITVEWKASTGAKAYQVWIAKSGSNEYAIATSTQHFPNAKVTISGTTATITGIAAGSYKVRIKASTDGTTWPKLAEASSEYASVTVR